ncbi:hypothetical protein V6B16_13670 [Salinimicrobium catena]|uniref:hypothetical protein n=1 Tax=Salinimicrobium catena TaxID=390640 RepID=UPI002FE4A987
MRKKRKSDEILRKKSLKSSADRKEIHYKGNNEKRLNRHQKKLSHALIKTKRTKFYNYLKMRNLLDKVEAQTNFKIPKEFSLVDRPKESQTLITDIANAYELNNSKKITIDFSQCTKITYGVIFVLDCILTEIAKDKVRLEQKYKIPFRSKIDFISSKNEKVNSRIFSIGFIKYFNNSANKEDTPHSTTKTLSGSKNQEHPMDNKKSVVSYHVVDYIDKIINEVGWKLKFQTKNFFGKLIGEILNNAEDHSDYDRWFIRCTAFKKSDEATFEVNIQFLNFGPSIFEGLEQSLPDNHSVRVIKEQAEKISSSKSGQFNIESLMTLYSLQEGVSRLKHEDHTRGFGTITFISSFLELSYHFEDQESELFILSGNTKLKITDKYKPFEKEGKYFISLNEEQNLMLPPDSNYLKTNSTYFPGTLISAKIFINKDDFDRKYSK